MDNLRIILFKEFICNCRNGIIDSMFKDRKFYFDFLNIGSIHYFIYSHINIVYIGGTVSQCDTFSRVEPHESVTLVLQLK